MKCHKYKCKKTATQIQNSSVPEVKYVYSYKCAKVKL